MKFAICQEMFTDWDWPRQCQFIAEVGYKGVEVAPFTLAPRIGDVSKERRRLLRRQAEDQGLTVIGLHWLLAKTEGFSLTSADPAVRRATAAYLGELGEACADLGGDLMVFGSPQQRNLPAGVSRAAANLHAAEVFRMALPRLADLGVRICLEPLTAKETDFINTCAEAMEVIGQVDHPNLCLHMDVKAMLGAESKEIPDLIAEYAAHAGHFHVNDTNLLGPGMGSTDFAPIFAALERARYAGWVSVEVFDYSPGAAHIARTSFESMQKTLERIAT